MDIETYATSVRKFAVYNKSTYPSRGLRSEIGEVFGVLAKADRGDFEEGDDEFCKRLLKEVGDCYWMLNEVQLLPEWEWEMPGDLELIAAELGIETSEIEVDTILEGLWSSVSGDEVNVYVVNDLADLLAFYGLGYEDALQANYDKLAERFEQGTIKGDGDDR